MLLHEEYGEMTSVCITKCSAVHLNRALWPGLAEITLPAHFFPLLFLHCLVPLLYLQVTFLCVKCHLQNVQGR